MHVIKTRSEQWLRFPLNACPGMQPSPRAQAVTTLLPQVAPTQEAVIYPIYTDSRERFAVRK